MRSLFDCTGKVALITGGNSGIGLGFATGIARMGGTIAIWSNDPAKDAEAIDALTAAGAQRVQCYGVDVSDEGGVLRGYETLMKDYGRIDCIVANAGAPPNAPSFLELSSADWHKLLDVNLHGTFYTLLHGARWMVRRAKEGELGGSLVFCGSLSMFQGFPGTGNYATAKGGIGALMRTVAVELGEYGIRANTVAPGFTKTGIMAHVDAETTKIMDAHFASKTPLQRPGTPADFEGIAAYLCSDASRFHSGDTMVIDGASLVLPAQAS